MKAPEERTEAEIAEQLAELRRYRFCPACCRQPCQCTDEATDLLLDERFFDPGDDAGEPGEWAW